MFQILYETILKNLSYFYKNNKNKSFLTYLFQFLMENIITLREYYYFDTKLSRSYKLRYELKQIQYNKCLESSEIAEFNSVPNHICVILNDENLNFKTIENLISCALKTFLKLYVYNLSFYFTKSRF